MWGGKCIVSSVQKGQNTHVYPEVERAGGALLDTWLVPALSTQFQAFTESIYEYEIEQMPVNQHTVRTTENSNAHTRGAREPTYSWYH